jgi:hypothetical protein
MDLMKIGMEAVDWIRFIQDRDWWQALVSTVINLSGPIKGREFLD